MRPPVSEVAPPRSRKSSLEQQQRVDPRTAAPSTFFLARSQRSDGPELSPVDIENQRESMYGVQSFDETISTSSSVAASPPELDSADISKPISINASPVPQQQWAEDLEEDVIHGVRQLPLGDLDAVHSRKLDPSFSLSNLTSPRPQTPLNLFSHDEPSSLPSSPKSITNQSTRHFDDISITDGLSQAIASGDEDDESHQTSNQGSDTMAQLIMPSITMPSRRPFTEKGRALGRVKLLLAGTSGTGKTSLIKSIVQICEDIVHVDSFDEPVSSISISRRGRSSSRPSHRPNHALATVSEIYASSKPYPSWWSDLEDSRILRRRKSTGEIVLERNICFVDTSASRSSPSGQTETIIQYMSQQLLRATSALDGSNVDFQNLLAGNGGSQVDAILFLVSHETLSSDVESISRLSAWTNVVPLIAKSDLLTPDQILDLKFAFNKKATMASIKPFHLFQNASTDMDEPPFAVSTAKSNDDSIMDASTLMSPDYVQPLVPSDLASLVHGLFDRENTAWLRHSAAKKLAQRQREMVSRRQTPLQNSALSFSSSPYGLAPSYAMARVSDYSRHEEKRARIQLAKWASDLQQSLQNERERYVALAKGDRAVWLTERLGECVIDGTLVPVAQPPALCGLRVPSDKLNKAVLVRTQNGESVEYHITNISPLDPLGVVRWSEDLKQRGWAMVQIVGSFGVVGGLALWLAKTWGLSPRTFSEWRFDWYCTSN